MTEPKIHWKPQSKQETALARTEDEVLFGGGRGGGKTDAGQAWCLYDVGHPALRVLVIRRNAVDLDDWIDRAKRMFAPTGARFIGDSFIFPSGAKIKTGHLATDDAYTRYQGHEYQRMLIEELTHIPSEALYEKLLGSCRSSEAELRPQVFATTNPDGPGYEWVKSRWGIPDEPNGEVITVVDPRSDRTRVFIPALLADNPSLEASDPGYRKYLESINDEDQREAWLKGSWRGLSAPGAYYKNQIAKAEIGGRITNIPYDATLLVHTWWDLGVGDSTTIGFFQVVGKEWRAIDCYEASGEGLAHYAQVLQSRGYVYGVHFAPHDIEVRELGTGKSRKEIAKGLGIDFQVTPNLPIDDGINALRSSFTTLWFDKTKCTVLLKALRAYQKEWNEKMGEFKPHPLHNWASHMADMMRYWAVSHHLVDRGQPIARRFIPKH